MRKEVNMSVCESCVIQGARQGVAPADHDGQSACARDASSGVWDVFSQCVTAGAPPSNLQHRLYGRLGGPCCRVNRPVPHGYIRSEGTNADGGWWIVTGRTHARRCMPPLCAWPHEHLLPQTRACRETTWQGGSWLAPYAGESLGSWQCVIGRGIAPRWLRDMGAGLGRKPGCGSRPLPACQRASLGAASPALRGLCTCCARAALRTGG